MEETRIKNQPQQPVTVMMVPQPVDEDKINLLELWRVLVRKRFLIATMVLFCLCGGAVYAFTAKPVYESRAVIQIGQIDRLIEGQRALLQRLSLKWGDAVKVREKGVSHIEITSAGATPQLALDLAKKVVEQVIAEHRAVFDSTSGIWQKER